MTEQVRNIYQACRFRDITGLRIVKIGKTQKDVEFVTYSTLASLGDEASRERLDIAPAVRGPENSRDCEEAGVLNGPQLEGGGNNQDEIDNILSSFD